MMSGHAWWIASTWNNISDDLKTNANLQIYIAFSSRGGQVKFRFSENILNYWVTNNLMPTSTLFHEDYMDTFSSSGTSTGHRNFSSFVSVTVHCLYATESLLRPLLTLGQNIRMFFELSTYFLLKWSWNNWLYGRLYRIPVKIPWIEINIENTPVTSVAWLLNPDDLIWMNANPW